MAASLFYGRGKLPYCTYQYPINFAEGAAVTDESAGTIFPILLTPAAYRLAFWRVKKWKFTATLSIDAILNVTESYAGNTWDASANIELIFDRQLAERQLLCRDNSWSQSPWSCANQTQAFSGSVEYVPYLETEPVTESASMEATVSIDPSAVLGQDDQFAYSSAGKSLTDGTKLAAALVFTVQVSGSSENKVFEYGPSSPGGSFFFTSAQSNNTPLTDTEIGTVSVEGLGDPQSVPVFFTGDYETYGSEIDGLSLTNMKLEPHEWFAYALRGNSAFYDSETGKPVTP